MNNLRAGKQRIRSIEEWLHADHQPRSFRSRTQRKATAKVREDVRWLLVLLKKAGYRW